MEESDVTATLSELERKLKELERELEAVGRSGEADTDPGQAGWTPPADASPPSAAEPGPPAVGATPFTASWHGTQAHHPAPPPPPPAWNGAPAAVPVAPPAAPWPSQPGAWQAAPPPDAPGGGPAPPPAAGLHRQLDELLAFRERLVRSTNELVAELSRVLGELGADVGPVAPPDPHDEVFSGRVTIEAGPFGDLATLAAFEQALAHTQGVAEVAVRALDAGRATIDVSLGEPVALGAALRLTAPVPFTIQLTGAGFLGLAIGQAGGWPPS
jgi:hypothetical protein